MIMTNKMFMPIILSHLHLERAAMGRAADSSRRHTVWWRLSGLSEPRPALLTFVAMLALLAGATWQSRQLQTGDVGAGVPELRAESRYNRDNRQIIGDYSIGMDVLSVYVETEGHTEACLSWEVMNAVERFDLHMRGVVGVQSVSTVAGLAKLYVAISPRASPLVHWEVLGATAKVITNTDSSMQNRHGGPFGGVLVKAGLALAVVALLVSVVLCVVVWRMRHHSSYTPVH